MATSATDLIVPTGLLLWILLTQFSVFFIFLWKGGSVGKIHWSSIFGVLTSVISFVIGITPQPILWIYDNQSTTFVYSYMVPQAQSVDIYYLFVVFELFLVIVSSLKIMLDTDLLGGGGE